VSVAFRPARRDDVAAILALLRDDALGAARETMPLAEYHAAFDRMAGDAANLIVVGEAQGAIVATYQITYIDGLSLRAARRAQVESVRVAQDRRGQGIGRAMFADVEHRARAAGCALIQLTMNQSRTGSAKFYAALGFTPSHIGYKRDLT